MPFIRNQLKGKMSHTKLTFMSFFFSYAEASCCISSQQQTEGLFKATDSFNTSSSRLPVGSVQITQSFSFAYKLISTD